MKRYIAYLNYVLRHKWLVFLACVRLGVPLRGLLHDASKLLPDEFFTYARWFYLPDGSRRTDFSGMEDVDRLAFDRAWLLHQNRNRHHWNWWVLREALNESRVLPMPTAFVLEMVADWSAAGKAPGSLGLAEWYEKNRGRLILEVTTRIKVEAVVSRLKAL